MDPTLLRLVLRIMFSRNIAVDLPAEIVHATPEEAAALISHKEHADPNWLEAVWAIWHHWCASVECAIGDKRNRGGVCQAPRAARGLDRR